jgi:uncharacterized membrane protein YkvA (DUF1232 family)
MTDAGKDHAAVIARWLASYREDVELFVTLLEADDETVSERGRESATGVLNYQLKKLDLAPDWHQAVGYADDALVLRSGAVLFHANNLTELPRDVEQKLNELRDDDQIVRALCGEQLYERFYKRVRALREERILGRLPDEVVKDRAKAAALATDVRAHLDRYPVPHVTDDDKLLLDLRNYLSARLPA